MILHPEGNINNNPNLTGIVEILCEQGYEVDIFSRRRDFHTQEAPCPGAQIFLTDLVDPLDTAILFAPGVQISEETIASVKRAFRQYDLVIGVDLGITEACLTAKILKVPFGLISYELYFGAETGPEFKESEIIACRDVSFAVCQDKIRSACLAAENRIPIDKILNIPVAGRSVIARERSYALHEALGIDKNKKIALYIGTATAKWAGVEELLASTRTWDDSWVLVLHHRYGTIMQQFIDNFGCGKNVYVSPFGTLPFDEMRRLLNAADIGIAFYTPLKGSRTHTGLNLEHIGLASGKIATYLQHDLPILINELGEMSEHVRNYSLGRVVTDFPDIGRILERIDVQELSTFAGKCQGFIKSHLDLDMTVEPLLDVISKLLKSDPGNTHKQNIPKATLSHRSTQRPPRISIVTPSYNQAQYLEECMDSVLSQGYPNLEYVVMDGGSTDGSVEIIKKYAKYLTYWQSFPDGGQYAAINAGFARTSGEIMAWLNSDDRYYPNAFLKVACTFTEHPEVDWLTGIQTLWGSKGEIKWLSRSPIYFSRTKYLSGNFGKPCIQQESTFWRRKLWNQAGGRLDTKCTLAADAELWLRFFRYAQLYNVNTLLGGFRYHGNQRSVLNIRKYAEEIQNEINHELKSLPQGAQFSPMPERISVRPETYIKFADDFGIPRFMAGDMPIWQNFLRSVTDSVIDEQWGLEAASTFLDEISLWRSNGNDLPLLLTKKLQQQIMRKEKAEGLILAGERCYHQGDLYGALKATFEALDIWPTSAAGDNNLGVLLYHKGKIAEAIEYFVKATRCDESKRELYRNLAVIFLEQGQRDKIQWALDYYLGRFPDDMEMKQFYRRLMECP